ncbi:MAG TPA: toprim domain-containing protein, partial [Burkholderiales bacterium]|nr:toprim domain-containing protein [Burkholderiales bacterium]
PNYKDKALLDCGLVIENEQGKRYDRFRDRVMFPIQDRRGAIIGFGGRVLSGGDSGPKYMNSPETSLFEKGRELYGLTQARNAIRQSNRVLVVEGYMDVVALAQYSVENAVATLGTATTLIHIQTLLRSADEIVFCFDGDAAGQRAAWHALEVSLEALSDKKTLKFLFLPAEHDPDSFVRERGTEAFEQSVREAQPLSAFLLDTLRKQADLSSLEGRSKLIAEAKTLLKRVAAPGLQLQLVKALADMTQMTQMEVARLTEIRLAATGYTRPVSKPTPRTGGDVRLERELLRCVLLQTELASLVDFEFLDRSHAEGSALAAVIDALRDEPALTPALLCERFQDGEHGALIAGLQAEFLREEHVDEDLRAVAAHTVAALADRRQRVRFEELKTKINAGQASRDEQREYAALSVRKRGVELASGAGAPI